MAMGAGEEEEEVAEGEGVVEREGGVREGVVVLDSTMRWWLTAHPMIFSTLSDVKTCFLSKGEFRFVHSISLPIKHRSSFYPLLPLFLLS